MSARTWTVRRRDTGEVGTVWDVTDRSDRELAKLRNALVMKVDFEHWELVDSEDES